jgi:arylsulfatase A-like enzyme
MKNSPELPKQPNILIVMTDHQRADTVLSEHPAPTPNMERLAREGIRFESAYCPSPHCCPSRAAFHTGLYPSRSGVWNNVNNEQRLSWGLNEGIRCFSDCLTEAGYTCAISGKWHVDARRGPNYFGWRNLRATSVPGDHMGWTWHQYMVPGATLSANGDLPPRKPGEIQRPGYPPYRLYGIREQEGHDTGVTAAAVKALPELAASGKPWCLFVGYIGPHDPYFVPQRYLDSVPLESVALPPNYDDDLRDKPNFYRRMRQQIFDQLSPEEIRDAIRHFYAYCAFLDDQLGEVLAALDATGQADDTLVLFCSDHGDYCGDHGLFAKGIPSFRTAYHVPAIVRWPNGIANPGRTVEEFLSLADFAPTFRELAGAPSLPASGKSLVPFLRGEVPDDWRDALFGQCDGTELYYTQRWVQTRQWRYVFNGFDFDELYDLKNDPHEKTNLSEDPAFATVKAAMAKRLWQLARQEQDSATLSYITVGVAPVGPGCLAGE